MRKYTLLAISFISIYSFSFSQNKFQEELKSGYVGDTIKGLKTLKKSINFCVIGDWGRNGHYHQKEVANMLGAAMTGIAGDFVISTGDNFYPKGIKSVNDPLFKSSFEDVYTMHALQEDWYVVLGNHDYKENPWAQIEYSNISRRWKLPSFYYSFKKQIDKDNYVEFFCIDTSPFQTDYYDGKDYSTNVKLQDTAAQINWLKTELKKSTATWKIVVGHHPLYSAGKRMGQTQDMYNKFSSIFNEFKVDAYLCGHEHHLEYDKVDNNCFHHFVSGAGSEIRPVKKADYAKFVMSQHGFFALSITSNKMQVQAISEKGDILFENIINK